jgi:hypothetical protein
LSHCLGSTIKFGKVGGKQRYCCNTVKQLS